MFLYQQARAPRLAQRRVWPFRWPWRRTARPLAPSTNGLTKHPWLFTPRVLCRIVAAAGTFLERKSSKNRAANLLNETLAACREVLLSN